MVEEMIRLGEMRLAQIPTGCPEWVEMNEVIRILKGMLS